MSSWFRCPEERVLVEEEEAMWVGNVGNMWGNRKYDYHTEYLGGGLD